MSSNVTVKQDKPVWIEGLDEGFFPNLHEAIQHMGGDPFEYRVCEKGSLEIPAADDIRWWVGEFIADSSGLFDSDAASEVADAVAIEIAALADALVYRNGTAWYPTGEVLEWTNDDE